MFDSEIERKIIDFIRKSPIGVTSTEIAGYLDINRITLAKYLDVIRERMLIDFKRLGMAKLWYIPVNFTKESFFFEIASELTRNMNEEQARELLNKAGAALGKKIFDLYRQFYGVEKLGIEQFAEAVVDVHKKIGAAFVALERTSEKFIFINTQSPFGNAAQSLPGLSILTSSILGTMAVKSFGYAKVSMRKTLAKDGEDFIIVYIKKTEESEKEKATDYVETSFYNTGPPLPEKPR